MPRTSAAAAFLAGTPIEEDGAHDNLLFLIVYVTEMDEQPSLCLSYQPLH